jgi:nitronate monooxygenase
MGPGFSLAPLASEVTTEGGLGTISSAGLSPNELYEEIKKAKRMSNNGPIAVNILCKIVKYKESVEAAIKAGADAIVSGAGLPLGLPSTPPGHTALIPIISSARALELIVRHWERFHYRPDAAVLEGPLAGGHLGFKFEDIDNPECTLENLLPLVLKVAHKHGDFPIIVAGGIYTHEDIIKFLKMGASAVQMSTRFLVTEKSSASEEYKQAVISASMDDIIVVSHPEKTPASPCGLPFRLLTSSPMVLAADNRELHCPKGWLAPKGICKAQDNRDYFCACGGLDAASFTGRTSTEQKLYTVGQNACRVDRELTVHDLMHELCGEKT